MEQDIAHTDLLVKGRVIQTGPYSITGLLEVDEYLIGSGGQHLIIRTAREDSVHYHNRGYYSCSRGYDRLRVGLEGYFSLSDEWMTDGTYWASFRSLDSAPRYAFMDVEGGGPLMRSAAEYPGDVAFLSGSIPQKPNPAIAPPPLWNPLIVHTEKGSIYLLPVTGEDPIKLLEGIEAVRFWGSNMPTFISGESLFFLPGSADRAYPHPRPLHVDCLSVPCLAASRSGLFGALIEASGDKIQGMQNMALYELEASAFLLSPQENYIAVWNETRIQIHDIIPGLSQALVTSTPWEARPDLLGRAMWSPNDRYLAFNDAAGLWLWDIHSINPPTLLRATTGAGQVPLVGQFSPQGSYLSFSMGDQTFNIDLASGHTLPGGMFSEDEQRLATPIRNELGSFIRIYDRLPRLEYKDSACFDSLDFPAARPVWDGHHLICVYYWQFWDDETGTDVYFYSLDPYEHLASSIQTRIFAYDPHSDQIAAVSERDQQLHIFNRVYETEVILPIRDQLDSPIQALYWYPTVMFAE
jgi:hypothetical protein